MLSGSLNRDRAAIASVDVKKAPKTRAADRLLIRGGLPPIELVRSRKAPALPGGTVALDRVLAIVAEGSGTPRATVRKRLEVQDSAHDAAFDYDKGDGRTLRFVARDPDVERAKRLATEFGEAYLGYRRSVYVQGLGRLAAERRVEEAIAEANTFGRLRPAVRAAGVGEAHPVRDGLLAGGTVLMAGYAVWLLAGLLRGTRHV